MAGSSGGNGLFQGLCIWVGASCPFSEFDLKMLLKIQCDCIMIVLQKGGL